jgi:acetyl-CoA acetyltransferase
MADAGAVPADIDLVAFGNAMGGSTVGQEMVRAQVLLSDSQLRRVPMINVENACASSSTALHVALNAVRSGQYDTALVVGAEKMTAIDKPAVLKALMAATDLERIEEYNYELTGQHGATESFFMEMYAAVARAYMESSGITITRLAEVAAKNSFHGSLNPNAHFRKALTVDEVLAGRVVAEPLTVLMCSPISDGAAALVIQADDVTGQAGRRSDAPVRIRASVLASGGPSEKSDAVEKTTALAAYESAGLGPADLDVVELHDGASPMEVMLYEHLLLCDEGEGPRLVEAGATTLGGRIPVNVSGGLVSRGHPIGATGCAQIVELVTQLRGRAGVRQVPGARVGLAENGGGYLHPGPAACVVSILSL